MNRAKITNKYIGWNEASEQIAVTPIVESEHPEINKIFEDLFEFAGEYNIDYEYDGKFIKIYHGSHTPIGQHSLLIDKQWLDNAIEKSQQNKRMIINCIN